MWREGPSLPSGKEEREGALGPTGAGSPRLGPSGSKIGNGNGSKGSSGSISSSRAALQRRRTSRQHPNSSNVLPRVGGPEEVTDDEDTPVHGGNAMSPLHSLAPASLPIVRRATPPHGAALGLGVLLAFALLVFPALLPPLPPPPSELLLLPLLVMGLLLFAARAPGGPNMTTKKGSQ